MNTISDIVKAITVKNRPARNFLKKRKKIMKKAAKIIHNKNVKRKIFNPSKTTIITQVFKRK